MNKFQQTWDNSHFYSGSQDPQIIVTVEQTKLAIAHLTSLCAPFNQYIAVAENLPEDQFVAILNQVKLAHFHRTEKFQAFRNLQTFISSTLSTDTLDGPARAWKPTLQQLSAEISQASKALDVFLTRVSDPFIQQLITEPALQELSFALQHARKHQDQLLSLPEEQLLTGLSVNGLQSWGNLYTELAGSLKCDVNGEQIGLAAAFNRLSDSDRTTRAAAWHGVRSAWETQSGTVAAILNAINGWRLEETKQRGTQRTLHYLDQSCHDSRIDRATLTALMDSTYAGRSIGQRALRTMGKVLGVETMEPWDLFAPPPVSESVPSISFDEAIALIASAFSQLTPPMGEFAIMMAEKGWIDAKPTPARSTGAYCSSFSDPREPRVFMTFEGSMNNVLTLAHELGHAWHNWVMRDLPRYKTYYSMTLAETASIFAETLVRDALFAKATTPAQQLAIAWEDGAAAATFLLNIPARFTFEQKLVENRKQGFVIADQLKIMMHDSWQHWYEDSLGSYDDMFWASKLHFSIASLSFYNYPYLFGYLFSLGIYAQKDRYADAFNALYTNLLRDTGSMTAETLVQTHLQKDIRQPEFWQASLDIVNRGVTRLEKLAS